MQIYINQRSNAKGRGHAPPDYTKEELREWFWSQPNAEKLYYDWVISGYDKKSRPSVDRIDDYKGYSFCNIQLMTWNENNRQTQPKRSIAVLQYDLDMNFIKEHESAKKALLNLIKQPSGHIGCCCKGKRKTAHGFIWRYK